MSYQPFHSRSRGRTYRRSVSGGAGTVLAGVLAFLALVAVTSAVGLAFTSFLVWLFWNVAGAHEVFHAPRANFDQVLVAAIIVGAISGGSRARVSRSS